MDALAFTDAIDSFAAAGILTKDTDEIDADDGGVSLASLLRKDVFADASVVDQISSHLRAGRLIIIPDALDSDFAERVYAALDKCTKWRPYEDFDRNFHYRHHNLYDPEDYPSALKECERVFGSKATRGFVERLSGRPCWAPLSLGASWYQPGDHSLPHQDESFERQVAFVWHLTRDWDSSWGGHLVWCPTGTLIKPMFNCLQLFVVSSTSLHFVSVVSGRAQGKRLTVNGWWNGSKQSERDARRTNASPPQPDRFPRQLYGAERLILGDVSIF
jgi:Rps23 Pro-64 3,4-dihydroxylase Tpa1-like proline 4-hydroxylase